MTDTTVSRPDASTADRISLADIKEREVAALPAVPPMSRDELAALAATQLNQPIALAAGPFTLTARRPYEPAGLMDFYRPGRWDSTSDRVYMSTIVTGSSPGIWEGTVGYAQHKVAAAGTYLVAVRFNGYQTTMKANGPWGSATAYTASYSDVATVTALWTGAANATLYFSFSAVRTGNLPGLAYLHSVQIYKVA